MVMIPSDVGLQVRGQVEPALQPVRAVAEIPGDLPELQPGQVFSARIQEVLPQNTYKALVAGHALTLALPEGAKAGDTLELVMVERTPQAILARLANGATATAGATADASASLSRTGQLIAALLARDGETAPRLALSASRPLLPAAPAAANQLAAELPAALARAVTTSGLFYESHQVQWVLGERPLASLLLEPQGRHASLAVDAAGKQAAAPMAVQADVAGAENSALAGRRAAGDGGVSALSLLRTLFGGAAPTAEGAANHAAQAAQTGAALASSGIPDDLRPLVQQQLDAAATQRLAWHGEVWPRQTMDWEIAHDETSASPAAGDAASWQTTVHLTLPRLGELAARLTISGQQVSLTVQAADAACAADLRTHALGLQTAFAAAGLALQRLDVRHGD